MNDCLFCKIINGDIPSYTIYEDEIVKVFLDINPSTNGDCLIIPKKHFTNINDIDLDTLCHINKVSREIYSLLKEKLNCEGLTFVQNNDFGQEIKHYHMHATPRYKTDNLMHTFNKKELIALDEIFNKIK
ncbi:MAG: HIT domain-containing protein [bacterium]|nr:HIT domain-containing protein [bacterium]